MSTFPLDQYFKRIEFHGEAKPDLETVTAMMRCQLMSVPFENLDVQAGKIISLDHQAIVEKIVNRQRGGYCYEVNGLFAMALDALHIPYCFVAARPLAHGAKRPKTHMAIIVSFGTEKWLCDCGYGGYGIRAPLRLSSLDTEVKQDGDLFMLSPINEHEIVLNTCIHGEWEPQYSFDLSPQIWTDFIPANYYNSTHHDSIFVRKLLVVICTANGRKILFGHSLKIISNGHQEKHLLTPENRATILREEFGLVTEELFVS
jgi:N-hydroxyarylamine O-acetyltransferase